MKVHLIKKQTIEDFAAINASSKNSFKHWLEKLKYADWDKPTDIMETFGSADFIR